MRRAERLFRLINEMRTRGISRANELARHLEVSVSTIYRDIAHLQASGLPIEGEAGVGYLLRPGFDLPNVTFTYDQIDALAVGLSFVERTGDPVLAAAAREARAKIQASLPQPEERKLSDAPFYNIQNRNGATPDMALLREAIRKREVVEIAYKNGAGKQSDRRVRPLVIWNLTDGWMFSAWCELRQDFRTFRFDRITSLTLTGEEFVQDEATGLSAFMEMERCESREH
ncbi:YafY family protein [Kiloniella laminariae]|uniref:YafY family protein n=1 Tax=Kiloniella laminariae TaxID=454162 RepID=A0ABT4LFE8_9PROT|nr:YafY family protein [Kiloniella laminariae]MCZ4279817.1 YafY family protein [Kiloniella laminariae]